MNIRVQPTVRCSFVPEENVLRIVLKEVIGGSRNVGSSTAESSESRTGGGSGDAATQAHQQEIVVYALKVRCELFERIFFFFFFPVALFVWETNIVVVSLAVHVPNMISKNSQSRSSKVHILKLLQL